MNRMMLGSVLVGLLCVNQRLQAASIRLGENFDEHNLVDRAKAGLPTLIQRALKKVPGTVTAAGYMNADGNLMAYVTLAAVDGSDKMLTLDGGNGAIVSVETKDKGQEAAAKAAEEKADAEIAAKDPHSEEARKASEKAKGEQAPGPSAKSSVSVATGADSAAVAKAAKVSMLKALMICHKRYPQAKPATAYLARDDEGHVFYGVNVKHANGTMTLIYLDPANGAILGTAEGG